MSPAELRRLLELAAKAAGARQYDWDTSRDGLFIRDGAPVILAYGDYDSDWNPADDDGDSRRLEVKLRIKAYYTDNAPPELGLDRECAIAVTPARQWFSVAVSKAGAPDECAALRLAVLRAAAAMGEAMP